MKTIEEAIEVALGLKSPSEQWAEPLIHAIWADLVEAGLPVQASPIPYNTWNEEFVMGEGGKLASASMTFAVETVGRELLQATVLIHIQNLRINRVTVRDIYANGVSWQDGTLNIQTDQPLPKLEMEFERSA